MHKYMKKCTIPDALMSLLTFLDNNLPSGLELILMTGQNSVIGFSLNLVFQ